MKRILSFTSYVLKFTSWIDEFEVVPEINTLMVRLRAVKQKILKTKTWSMQIQWNLLNYPDEPDTETKWRGKNPGRLWSVH